MQNAGLMSGGNAASHLSDDVGYFFEVHAFRLDAFTQGCAFDVLHDQIRRAVVQLACVKYADDARIVDSRERFNLLMELLNNPLVLQSFFEQHFYYYAP